MNYLQARFLNATYLNTYLILYEKLLNMRIFVASPIPSIPLLKINVLPDSTTDHLLQTIARQFKLNIDLVILKMKHEKTTLRVNRGWPIHAYPIKNGCRFLIQMLEGATMSSIFPPTEQLPKINEELEEGQENTFLMLKQQTDKNRKYEGLRDWGKYLETTLQHFLSAIRSQQLQRVAEILKEQPTFIPQQKIEDMMLEKNRYMLNQLGICGHSALHQAIQQQDLNIISFLLIKSSDPNIINEDQYSPLQLAVSVKSLPSLQTLLDHPKIDINLVTSKGTALHVALALKQEQFVARLIEHGADLSIPDQNEKTGEDLMKVMKIILKERKEKIQIPYICKGRVLKLSSIHKNRILYVNPFCNEFRIDEKQPRSKALKVSSIKKVHQIKNKSWLMKKQYYYFEILYEENKRYLFGVQNQKICQKWLDEIQKACLFVGAANPPKVRANEQITQYLNDQNNQISIFKKQSKPESVNFNFNPSPVYIFKNIDPPFEPDLLDEDLRLYRKESQDKITTSVIDSQEGENTSCQKNLNQTSIKKIVQTQITADNSTISQKQNGPYLKEFQILRQLGKGSFGKVYLARHYLTHQLYALKVLGKKKLMVKRQLKYALGQANILKKLDNLFTVKLYYSFQTPSNLFLAIDYCPYGDLSELLCDEDRLTEKGCKFYIAQIILAIEYLHKNQIIYRDLKPENILIDRDGFIKLTDFGLSAQKSYSMSFCGSRAYLSPEMLQKKGVGFESDIYGIGCILYEMLVGEPPYFDDDTDKLFDNIKRGKLRFPSFISKAAKSLINGLLQRNIKKRLGVKNINDIKKHEFFHKFQWQKLAQKQVELPSQLQGRFNGHGQVGLEVIKQPSFSDIDYEGPQIKINRIKDFDYIRQTIHK